MFATGFKVSKMLHPMAIVGKDGRELHDIWGPDDAKAYPGLTVPGFPNFFMLTGPNTGLAHGGIGIRRRRRPSRRRRRDRPARLIADGPGRPQIVGKTEAGGRVAKGGHF